MSVKQNRSQHFGDFIESVELKKDHMEKGQKRVAQPSEEPQNPPKVSQGEPRWT